MCSRGSQTSQNFVATDNADLLDLICTRYPGAKPSEYYGNLDRYQAFQFDLAMALKGKIRDQEHETDQLFVILEGMRGIMKAQGAKPKPLQQPKHRVFMESEDNELPLLSDILGALGGQGTVS